MRLARNWYPSVLCDGISSSSVSRPSPCCLALSVGSALLLSPHGLSLSVGSSFILQLSPRGLSFLGCSASASFRFILSRRSACFVYFPFLLLCRPLGYSVSSSVPFSCRRSARSFLFICSSHSSSFRSLVFSILSFPLSWLCFRRYHHSGSSSKLFLSFSP